MRDVKLREWCALLSVVEGEFSVCGAVFRLIMN